MERLVADLSNFDFIINHQLEQQIGLGSLPFATMNKSGAGVCTFYLKNNCPLNARCPLRHIKGDKTVVCKHWLRGLCKKGDDCDFLHVYDMKKMPECYFFSKFGICLNKECQFLHVDPASKIQDCAWYARGFCRNGPNCRNRHVRRVACQNYINGFCPDGPDCKLAHPRWWPLPGNDLDPHKQKWICHNCKERGHKVQYCHHLPLEERQRLQEQSAMRYQSSFPGGNPSLGPMGPGAPGAIAAMLALQKRGGGGGNQGPPKPLDEVTCYKCGDKGHYANKCTKGHLAFLSKGLHDAGAQPAGF